MFFQSFLSLAILLSGAAAFVPMAPTQPAVSLASAWGVTRTSEATASSNRVMFGLEASSMRNSLRLGMAASSNDATGPVKLIISGAPASGKGTQCEVIKETFGVVHLSTGDMLRAAVAAQTEVGKKAKDFMDSGKLVPDEVIIGVVGFGCHCSCRLFVFVPGVC